MNRRFGELPPIKAGRLVNFFKQALVPSESAFCRPMNSKCENGSVWRLFLCSRLQELTSARQAPFPLLEVIGTNERSTGGVLASKLRLL